MTKYSS